MERQKTLALARTETMLPWTDYTNMTEAVCSSETLVNTSTTWHTNPRYDHQVIKTPFSFSVRDDE
jgi:hypothetical protein